MMMKTAKAVPVKVWRMAITVARSAVLLMPVWPAVRRLVMRLTLVLTAPVRSAMR